MGSINSSDNQIHGSKLKSLKLALAVISFCLVACMVALVGVTYALFTQDDNLQNSVSSGSVEITLSGDSSPLITGYNAEPGGSYAAKFTLTNSGDAAFKCTISASVEEGDLNLAAYLDLYVVAAFDTQSASNFLGSIYDLSQNGGSFLGEYKAGQTNDYVAIVTFNSSAGNALQGASVKFSLTVSAVQYNAV